MHLEDQRPTGHAKPRTTIRLHLFRCCRTLSALLVFSNLLGAQTPDNSGFYLDVTGHALFPHATADPPPIAGQSAGLDTGAGLTAALGYTFRGGFSAEVEWGFQQVGIGNPDENFSLSAGSFFSGSPSIRGIPSIGTVGGILDDEGSVGNFLPFSFQIDGEIQIQSLMANLSYRHPAWRVSPYAGFGVGPFFYDGTIETQLAIDPSILVGLAGGDQLPSPLSLPLTVTIQERRFAYQLMTGLSFRVRQRVELRAGYRFRSGRSGPINADQVEGGVRFRF